MLIGEVAKKSGLSKDGIRYYESLGLIHSKPIRAGSKIYRDYDDTTLERLSLIALGKRLYFRLSEMSETLDRLISETISIEERKVLLKAKVAEVDSKIQDLMAARDMLAAISEDPQKTFVNAELKRIGLWIE